MNKYEIRYYQDGKWWGYAIVCNGMMRQGGIVRTRSAAIKDAQRELDKLQRSEQPLAA